MNNIYRITVNYMEPTSISATVIAKSVEDAANKFKVAVDFDNAPAEYAMEIESIELLEEGLDDSVTSLDDYREHVSKRTIN